MASATRINIHPAGYQNTLRIAGGGGQRSLVRTHAPPSAALHVAPSDIAAQMRMAPPPVPSLSNFSQGPAASNPHQFSGIAPRLTPMAPPPGFYRPSQQGQGGGGFDQQQDEEFESGDEEEEDGPPRLQKTPGTLSHTPAGAGFSNIANTDKILQKRIPAGHQSSKVEIPEADSEDEDGGDGGSMDDGAQYADGEGMDDGGSDGGQGEDDGDEFDDQGQDGPGPGPGSQGPYQPQTQNQPRQGGPPPMQGGGLGSQPMGMDYDYMPPNASHGPVEINFEYREKQKKLAELYNLQDATGVEPYTRHYDMRTETAYIEKSLQRANQSIMESETVSLGEHVLTVASSIVERASTYGNSVLQQRGSQNRLPDLEGLSWYVDQPEIKHRFREPLKRIHELHGAKVRSINPFWSLSMAFTAVVMQYGDAKNSRAARDNAQAQAQAEHAQQQANLQAQANALANAQAQSQQQQMQARALAQQQQQQQQQGAGGGQGQGNEPPITGAMAIRNARIAQMRQMQQQKREEEAMKNQNQRQTASDDVRITEDVDEQRILQGLRKMNPLQRRHVSEQVAHAADQGTSVIDILPPARPRPQPAHPPTSYASYPPNHGYEEFRPRVPVPAHTTPSGIRFHNLPPVTTRPVHPRGHGRTIPSNAALSSGGASTTGKRNEQSRGLGPKPGDRPAPPKRTLQSIVAATSAKQRQLRQKQGYASSSVGASPSSAMSQMSGITDATDESNNDSDEENEDESGSISEDNSENGNSSQDEEEEEEEKVPSQGRNRKPNHPIGLTPVKTPRTLLSSAH